MESNNKSEQAEKPAKKTEQTSSDTPNKAFPWQIVLLVLVAILITLPGAAALWYGWQQQQQLVQLENRLDEIADLKTDISQLGSAQSQLDDQLSKLNQNGRLRKSGTCSTWPINGPYWQMIPTGQHLLYLWPINRSVKSGTIVCSRYVN